MCVYVCVCAHTHIHIKHTVGAGINKKLKIYIILAPTISFPGLYSKEIMNSIYKVITMSLHGDKSEITQKSNCRTLHINCNTGIYVKYTVT